MQSNAIDIAVLRGSPLVRYAYGAASAVQYDVSTDLDPLCTYLATKAHVTSSVASLSALDHALRQGCRILHFSGRSTLVANEHCLGFETDTGVEFPFPVPAAAVPPVIGFGAEADSARLAAESTVHALQRSQRLAQVKLIVLMASQSATVVPSLLSAGAPSVICVDSRFDISDRAAALFSRALYDALFSGPSIRAAFESAKAHLNRLSLSSAADADLANEARKFVLLPLEESATGHDNSVFPSSPSASSASVLHFARASHLPALPVDFSERLIETQQLVASLTSSRMVRLRGVGGVGKSTLALAASRFIAERIDSSVQRCFSRVVFIDLKQIKSTKSSSLSSISLLLHAIASEIGLSGFEVASVDDKLDKQSSIRQLASAINTATGSSGTRFLIVFDGVDQYTGLPSALDSVITTLFSYCDYTTFLLTSQVLTPTLARLGTHRGVSEFELKPMDFAASTAVFRALCERRSPKEVFYNSLCAPLPRSPLNPLPPILGGIPARMVYLIQRGLPHVQSSAQEICAARDRGVTALTVSAVRERSTARPVWAPEAAQSAVQSRLRWGLQSAIDGLLESERVLRECGLPGPPPVKSANMAPVHIPYSHVFEKFDEFVSRPPPARRILWIHSDTGGSGKSVVVSLLAVRQCVPNAFVAMHSCRRDQSSGAVQCIVSMASQIAHLLPAAAAQLLADPDVDTVLDEAESSGVSTKLLLAAVEVLILRPLQAAREDIAATKARVLLLIDGLDELDLSEEGRNDFCAAWIALLEASPVGVYSVLSSSKDAAFERGLSAKATPYQLLPKSMEADVFTFVQRSLAPLVLPHEAELCARALTDAVLPSLVVRSVNQQQSSVDEFESSAYFRIALTVHSARLHHQSVGRALELTEFASQFCRPYESLADTCNSHLLMLRASVQTAGLEWNHVLAIFGVMRVAREPLTVAQLARLCSVSIESVWRFVSIAAGGLVRVFSRPHELEFDATTNADQRLQQSAALTRVIFSHRLVSEWCEQHIDMYAAHYALAQHCLQAVMVTATDSTSAGATEFVDASQFSDTDDDMLTSVRMLLFRYGVAHGLHHALRTLDLLLVKQAGRSITAIASDGSLAAVVLDVERMITSLPYLYLLACSGRPGSVLLANMQRAVDLLWKYRSLIGSNAIVKTQTAIDFFRFVCDTQSQWLGARVDSGRLWQCALSQPIDSAMSQQASRRLSAAPAPSAQWNPHFARVLNGVHTGSVLGIAWRADGDRIATAGDDCRCCVWCVSTVACVQTLVHPDRVICVTYSSDGSHLITGCADGVVRVWNCSSAQCTEFVGHTGAVLAVSVDLSGTMVCSASRDKSTRIWSLSEGRCLHSLSDPLQIGWTTACIFAGPDMIATASTDALWRMYDVRSGQLQSPGFKGHVRGINAIAYTPNGNLIATASDDRCIRIWTMSGACLHRLEGHSARVLALSFHPSRSGVLASTGLDGKVCVWQVDLTRDSRGESEPAQSPLGEIAVCDEITSVQWRPSGDTWLAVGSCDQTARLVDGRAAWSVPVDRQASAAPAAEDLNQQIGSADV